MSVSRCSQMRASVYDVPIANRASTPAAELMTFAAHAAEGEAQPETTPTPVQKGRSKIWDLHSSLHCSIVGTCLSQAELHRLLRRLNVEGADTAGNHDLHMLGVLLAARPKEGAKLLQKTLDKRHHLAIHRFAKAKDAAELLTLWEAAMSGGDVPGAYWAVLTHPLSTDALVRRVFGDVHMLSHLVGATNRADIRRLRELEAQNAALVERMDRQHRQYRADITERDQTIRRLDELVARKLADEKQLVARANDADNFLEVIRELEKRLDEEIAHRQHVQQRLDAVTLAGEQSQLARAEAERERESLRAELATLEAQIRGALVPDDAAPEDAQDLDGLTVLYVGGRAGQVPLLRALVERMNGQFIHHDGGIEQSATLLPGLISRADVALFPIDCVSHDAVAIVKRVCDQIGRPYMPLRTSSLACLLSALAALPAPAPLRATTLQ